MATRARTISVELPPEPEPTPPDLSVHPDVASLRERVARLETTVEQRVVDPAAAEALRLAGEAHQLAAQALERADHVTEPPADPTRVIAVTPPPSDPAPADPPSPETPPEEHPAPPRPWWHLSRML